MRTATSVHLMSLRYASAHNTVSEKRMAKVTPPSHTIRVMSSGQHVEVNVLRQLAADLPDTFDLFHSLDWAQANPGGDSHGEIDVVVVNQSGDIALSEIKAGELEFTPIQYETQLY